MIMFSRRNVNAKPHHHISDAQAGLRFRGHGAQTDVVVSIEEIEIRIGIACMSGRRQVIACQGNNLGRCRSESKLAGLMIMSLVLFPAFRISDMLRFQAHPAIITFLCLYFLFTLW